MDAIPENPIVKNYLIKINKITIQGVFSPLLSGI
jgi:hypothetical protein